jgi:hypothetical protein
VEPDDHGRYHDALEGQTIRALSYLRGTWRVERHLVDHLAAVAAGGGSGLAGQPAGRSDGRSADRSADRSAGRSGPWVDGRFDGTAEFLPIDGQAALAYHEAGELRFGDYRGAASRSLIYTGRPDGTADVCFGDGREFYHLDPRSGTWRGQHLCGRDLYEVTGQLLGADKYRERWRVRGPAKDYEIATTFTRRTGPEAISLPT